jgi:hypothetical protein
LQERRGAERFAVLDIEPQRLVDGRLAVLVRIGPAPDRRLAAIDDLAASTA